MPEAEQVVCHTGPCGSRNVKSRDVYTLGRGINMRFYLVAPPNSAHAGIFRDMEVHSPARMLRDKGQAHPVYHHCPAQGQHISSKYLWKEQREERKETGGKSRVLCPSICRKELLLEPWRCTASGWYSHLGLDDVKGGAEPKARDVHTTCTSSCGTKEKPDSRTLSPSTHRHCHEEADTPRAC